MRTTNTFACGPKKQASSFKSSKDGTVAWSQASQLSQEGEGGCTCCSWLQRNPIATGLLCLLINWNALAQKIGYPSLMRARASQHEIQDNLTSIFSWLMMRQLIQDTATAVGTGPQRSQFGCFHPSSHWVWPLHCSCCVHCRYIVLYFPSKTQMGPALICHRNRSRKRARLHTRLQKEELKKTANSGQLPSCICPLWH